MVAERDHDPGQEPAGDQPAARAYFELVEQLHLYAGERSVRELAKLTTSVSHTTVNAALRGPRIPTGRVSEQLFDVLYALAGEDLPEYLSRARLRDAWVAARREQTKAAPPRGRRTEQLRESLVTDPHRLAEIERDARATVDDIFQTAHEMAMAQHRVAAALANDVADQIHHRQDNHQPAPTGGSPLASQPGQPNDSTEESALPAELMRSVDFTYTVHTTAAPPRYHLEICHHLPDANPRPMPLAEARLLGYTPCGLCRPNAALAADQVAGIPGRAWGEPASRPRPTSTAPPRPRHPRPHPTQRRIQP